MKNELKLQPLGNRVLIRRGKPKDKTEGGLFLPDTAKDVPLKGEVLAVGPGRMVDGNLQPMSVRIGQVVLMAKYAGHSIPDSDDLVLVPEDELLGIVE